MSNVIDLGDGFAIEHKKKARQEFRDRQVTNLQLSYIPMHSQGKLTGRVRTFFVWIKGEPKPFEFAELVEVDQKDTLEPLIQRLSQKFQKRLAKVLEAGKPLPGKGFNLDKNALTIGKPGKETVIPIAQLDAMAIVEDKLNIWKVGEDAPVFKRPFSDKNVYPLSLALDGRIPNRLTDVQTDMINNTGEASLVAGTMGPSSGSEAGLGRIIFERKTTTTELVLLGFVAAVIAFLGYQVSGDRSAVPNYVFFALAGALTLYAFSLWGKGLECRERGVVKTSVFGKKELRYDQLAGFKFGKTAVYVNNVFQGYKIDLKFRPKSEFNGGSTISYKKKIKEGDTVLESFCSQVSSILAQEMFEELKTSGKTEWTKTLELRADGLVYRPTGLLGGAKEPIQIPYGNILKYDVNDGRFLLWVNEKPKSVTIGEPVEQENFFPGFAVFQSIVPSEL